MIHAFQRLPLSDSDPPYSLRSSPSCEKTGPGINCVGMRLIKPTESSYSHQNTVRML